MLLRAKALQLCCYFALLLGSNLSHSATDADADAMPSTSAAGHVYLLEINGVISPATADYIASSFSRIEDDPKSRLIIIRMDTPGGLDAAMRTIIQRITQSPVPVATLVGPTGARAASAGTYILYASHIAVMAPGTSIGAATPVSMGGEGKPPAKPQQTAKNPVESKKGAAEKTANEQNDIPDNQTAMRQKVVNDAIAYLQSLADLRGRDREWAKHAVLNAGTLTTEEALQKKIIDYVAKDSEDLLRQIDGSTVAMTDDRAIILDDVTTLKQIDLKPDWRQRFIAILTTPELAYFLFMLGFYGLLYEIISPGSLFPGIVGVIFILLASYAFQYIPIDYTGLGLVLFGACLILAELFVPGFGILAVGGAISMVIGSIFLFDVTIGTLSYPLQQAKIILWVALLLCTAMFVFLVWVSLSAKRCQHSGHMHSIKGLVGICLDSFENEGQIEINGEIWHAISSVPVRRNQRVEVVALEGLKAKIAPHN